MNNQILGQSVRGKCVADASLPVSRPILFSAPMVRALLAGTKTQTRRVVKAQPPEHVKSAGVIFSCTADNGSWSWLDAQDLDEASFVGEDFRCPYGVRGDLLWVRETWQSIFERRDGQRFTEARVGIHYPKRWIEYAATSTEPPPAWRPSIFMPRAASRITLRITDVRVERLQGISADDAIAEGWPHRESGGVGAPLRDAYPIGWYANLWCDINGAKSWDENPWAWALTFERVKP